MPKYHTLGGDGFSKHRHRTAGGVSPSGGVASVLVSPSSFYLPSGTQQLTAVLKDALGNTVAGSPDGWHSDAPGVASVSNTGLVTEVTPNGIAHITASSGSIISNASICQTNAAPASRPNDPGFPQFAFQPFDALNNADFFAQDSNANFGGPCMSIISDPTNGGSSNNVLQFFFPAGQIPGGQGPGSIFNIRQPRFEQLYFALRMKWSSDFTGPVDSGHQKLVYGNMFDFPVGGGSPTFVGVNGNLVFSSGHQDPITAFAGAEVQDFVPGADAPGQTPGVGTLALFSNRTQVAIPLGTWHILEGIYVQSTPGTTNGGLAWWVDGTLVGDFRNRISWRTDLTTKFSDFFMSPTYGGSTHPNPVDSTLWVKDFYVSGI